MNELTHIPTLEEAGMDGFELTSRARTALISAGVGIASWSVARNYWPEYQTPILLAGGAVGTIGGELYDSYLQSKEGNGMEGMDGWLKDLGNKLFSAATGAPRFISHLVQGDAGEFKLFDDQSVGESFKEQFAGNTAVASILLASMGVNLPRNNDDPQNTPVPQNNPVDPRNYSQQPPPQKAGISPVHIAALLALAMGGIYIHQKNSKND